MRPRGRVANVAGKIRLELVSHAGGVVKADTVEYFSAEVGLTDACLRRAWCTKRGSSKRYSSQRSRPSRHGGVITAAASSSTRPSPMSIEGCRWIARPTWTHSCQNDLSPTACGQPALAQTHCRAVNGQRIHEAAAKRRTRCTM